MFVSAMTREHSSRIGRSNSSFGHLKCFGCAISESVCTKLLHSLRFTSHLNRKVHILRPFTGPPSRRKKLCPSRFLICPKNSPAAAPSSQGVPAASALPSRNDSHRNIVDISLARRLYEGTWSDCDLPLVGLLHRQHGNCWGG